MEMFARQWNNFECTKFREKEDWKKMFNLNTFFKIVFNFERP